MKTLEEFLSELAKLNIEVWVENTRLRCNAPKDVLTPELRQQLVERKAEIMALLRRVEGESNFTESIRPVPRNFNEGMPLSFGQTRLWSIDQLEEEKRTGYYMRWPFHIIGKLNVAALERAIQEIVQRHEILRTSFRLVNGNPVQVIEPRVSINLSIVDCRDLFAGESSLSTIPSKIKRLVELEAQKPFDLAKAPLLRVTLSQLTEESHILVLAMHHIVYDDWSMPIFFKESSQLYAAFLKGEPSPLPELPIQYADFAVWQRRWLSGEVLQAQLDYWKQQLKGAPALLELPTDRSRGAIQTCRGAYRFEALSFEVSEKLALLSKRTGVTLFMTLLAAFGTLLYRCTGQEYICIGTPITNRNREEIEGLIGFFVNTLVMRTNFSGNPSFVQLLSRVREVALGAYAHQDLPFEELVRTLQPERSLSYTPLFQVMFQFHNESIGSWDLTDLTVSSPTVELRTAIFDLTLSMQNTSQGLIAEWEYNSDLFDDDTIARMAEHFQTLLSGIVAAPEGRISEISLLTKAERHQLLVSWNATQREYSQDKCIHQLFEEQVKRTPDAVAVVFEGEHLTYQQLNAKTNQLAHYLQSLGVGPEVLVGICAQRSLLMVIGLLGILKAGGAYVPLDPAYPPERLAYILSDAQVSVLLTQGQLVESLPQSGAQLICLDRDWKAIACSSESNPVTSVKASNLAYAIYTSGSTGSPKGVGIEHRSLVNFTSAAKVEYGINSCDRVLQFSTISFDVAAEEIYTCLASGGTLVLRTDEMLNSVSTFVQKCQEWQLTVLDLPVAYWHQLTSELANTEEMLPSSVRLVIIGGEAVRKETLKLWQKCVDNMLLRDQLLEPPLLMNAYGPTEATVAATICVLSESVLKNKQSKVPIGRPLSNVEAYILDRNLQPVPIGSSGELYIGGVCLARGYLNRPDLTAERFIPNPFSPISGDRLYKTGDLVRYLPDGNLEFLGRTDHQVKVRGFRIELGELEAVLRQHPVVEEAVVLALPEDSGQVQPATPGINSWEDIFLIADESSQTQAHQVLATEQHYVERVLAKLEESSEEAAELLLIETVKSRKDLGEIMFRNLPEFNLFLHIKDDKFIDTPQDFQRNWMLQRTLDEFADDMLQLDQISKRFISGSARVPVQNEWRASRAYYDQSQLIIEGQQVMQDWERPLMSAMADIATESHGDVLEVGFGMGISATYIQERGVKSHTIIECNDDVVKAFQTWRNQYSDSDIRLIYGKWQDVTEQLGTYDAVFFDTYPLSEEEFAEYIVENINFAEQFFSIAANCLREGGILTYYTNEIDSFSRRHQRLLFKHFKSFTLSVVEPLYPPEDCNYWWADSMVVVKAVK